VFYYLALLEPKIAHVLLQAVHPLLTVNSPLFDHVVLVLRKAMFSRELNARLIAVQGFLELLQTANNHYQDAEAHAKAQIDQVQFEILGFLRRSLAQQCEIRELLYTGLPKIFGSSRGSRASILELLLQHLLKYCRPDDDVLLSLADCTETTPDGETRIQEPIHKLLHCIVTCLAVDDLNADDGDGNGNGNDVGSASGDMHDQASESDAFVRGQLVDILERISHNLLKSELEAFELDKSSDYSGSREGQQNSKRAMLLYGCYEVCPATQAQRSPSAVS
jgi:fanconi anemia group I protein